VSDVRQIKNLFLSAVRYVQRDVCLSPIALFARGHKVITLRWPSIVHRDLVVNVQAYVGRLTPAVNTPEAVAFQNFKTQFPWDLHFAHSGISSSHGKCPTNACYCQLKIVEDLLLTTCGV
jgi:hypothetical protein